MLPRARRFVMNGALELSCMTRQVKQFWRPICPSAVNRCRPSGLQKTVQRVATTKQAEVSGFFIAGVTKVPSLAVVLPVIENGQPLFVVGVVFSPAIMSEIFKTSTCAGRQQGSAV